MRANRWWKLLALMGTAVAMPRMLTHLQNDPEAGLLGYHQWFGRTTILLSYWRSTEHLQRFAAAVDAPHRGPWRDFMEQISGTGNVGIWHETYQVATSDIEVVYNGMPRFGLAKATEHLAVGPGTSTARQRLGR